MTKRPFLFLLSALCLSLAAFVANGQAPQVNAKLDPPKILIGEETTLEVRVSHPKGAHVELTLPADTLVTGVEIKGISLSDSATITETLQEYIYHVTLTSFDSASYELRNIAAMVGGDIYRAQSAPILIVNTVPVDVDHPEKFAGLKGQWQPDFVWKDYIGVLFALLAFVLLCIAAYFLWKKYAHRPKKEDSEAPSPEPLRDPYEEAIEGMNELKSSGLIEDNRVKDYYTGMTDILRRFIHRVYGIDTSEKTSSEILESFRALGEKESELSRDLRRILETADFAKFAKYAPTQDENIGLWQVSLGFVEEVQKEKAKVSDETESEKGGSSDV